MTAVMISNLERDGEHRSFAQHGHADLATAGGLTVMRGVFEPGWRWSADIAPIVGGDSCQTRHLGYVLSGSMRVRMADGTESDLGPGDLFDLPAGHDAWVVGDQPCEMVDYSPDATRYARAEGIAAADDEAMALVRRGYAAFNTQDVDTLRSIFAADVVQHVPGHGPLAGTYKGPDAVLGYYGKLAEMTDGTFRAHLVDVHGDALGHVMALHQTVATRDGATRATRGSILFTVMGGKVTDLLELHADLPGDDAFFS
ncbi:nuclear transport factor 2 family protein [Jatrophihabitans sp.]|uniref:nuclear transport factor 2 family protein n=1 Tax=Jatrophihabitans sp. TaxID=1932789 RepID=UPI002C670D7F|nr:nuclear transport factor 2 family protein [Jatrophihabitans sp.]